MSNGGYLPPFSVSPLIRTARWTALILGIIYGISKHSYYSNIAEKEREIAAEKKAAREIELAQIRIIQAANEKRAFELLSQKPEVNSEHYSEHYSEHHEENNIEN